MPHYADGTEAKVGDQVVGKLYNTEGKRAGTIISITPGAESCNAMVQFTEMVPVVDGGAKPPRMVVADAMNPSNGPLGRMVLGEAHGSSGPQQCAYVCADYCDTNELTKIEP